jgi:tyrosine-protein kinase Etk/Wzc
MKDQEKNSKLSDIKDDIYIKSAIGAIIDGRYSILYSLLLSLFIAFFYIFWSTPLYKANGLIQIEDNAPGVPGLNDMSEIFSVESSSSTELHIIKSRFIIGQVVNELGLTIDAEPKSISILGKNFFQDDSKIEISKLEIPNNLYQEKLELIVTDKNKFSLFHDKTKLIDGVTGQLISNDFMEIKVEKIENAQDGSIFFVKKVDDLDKILSLQKRIKVSEKGRDTGIIEISITGGNKEKIIKIINSVSANYYLQNIQRMAAEAENSLNFLEQQIPKIEEQLESSEEALNSYRSKQVTVDISLEAQSALDSLVQIEADISAMSINEAEISKRFTANHPNYISFKRQQNNLLDQKNKLNQKLESFPDTQKEILRLKRDFEVNQAIFIALKNKREELSILKASTVGNIRIIDKAETLPKPVAPSINIIILLSIFLGFVFGLFYIAIINFLKPGIKDVNIFADMGLMIHATIPLSEKETLKSEKKSSFGVFTRNNLNKNNDYSILADIHPADNSMEAIRSLRTSLHFSMMDAENKLVLITSASPNAGKSFVILNLAVAIAQSGKKVILIDADMRKGYLHKRFESEAGIGLSEILSGTKDIDKCIRQTHINNLDIISRGSIPTNPSELCMGKNMNLLFKKLNLEYDIVLIDTPPVLAVTEASILGKYASTSLLVSRYDSCTVNQIKSALNTLNLNGIDIKGVIFNGIEKKVGNYYYDYGYYNYEYKSDDE